jgi:hypothetical protein
MQLDKQTTDEVVASIKAIAKHQDEIAARHSACLVDAEKFKLALQGLAEKSPEAVKHSFDDGIDGMNVVVQSGRISGYYLNGSWGYVQDHGLKDYIGSLASKRTERCDSRSK